MTTNEMTPADFAAINGNNDGFGNGWWILLLFLFGFGNGLGGFNGGYGNMMLGYDFPWLLNNTNNGFRDAMINDNITSIRDGIGGISTQLCGGFAGVTASVTNAQNALAQQLYTNQIADLERSFAAQTANTACLTNLSSQLAQCCCDNKSAALENRYVLATEACATRTADAQNTNAVLNALNSGVQSIKDQLCSDKIEAKNDLIAQLRSELLYARGQASQDVQTATIQAGQRALANEVEQYVAPKSIPAYIVQNPNCCTNACGCGSF